MQGTWPEAAQQSWIMQLLSKAVPGLDWALDRLGTCRQLGQALAEAVAVYLVTLVLCAGLRQAPEADAAARLQTLRTVHHVPWTSAELP